MAPAPSLRRPARTGCALGVVVLLCAFGAAWATGLTDLGGGLLPSFGTRTNEFQTELENWEGSVNTYREQLTRVVRESRAPGPVRHEEVIVALGELLAGLEGLATQGKDLGSRFNQHFKASFRSEADLATVAEGQRQILPLWDEVMDKVEEMVSVVQFTMTTMRGQAAPPAVDPLACTMCKRIARIVTTGGLGAPGAPASPEAVCRQIEEGPPFESSAERWSPFESSAERSPFETSAERSDHIKPARNGLRARPYQTERFACHTISNQLLGSKGSGERPSERMREWKLAVGGILSPGDLEQLYCQDMDLCDVDETLSERVLTDLHTLVESGVVPEPTAEERSCAGAAGSSFCLLSKSCIENENKPCPQGTSCTCYTGPNSTTVKTYAAFATLKGLAGAVYFASSGPAGMLAGAFAFFMTPTGDFEISSVIGVMINYFMYGKPQCKCTNLSCARDSEYGCRLWGPHEGLMNWVHSQLFHEIHAPLSPYWAVPEPEHKCVKGATGICWLTPCDPAETTVGVVLNEEGQPQGTFNCQPQRAEELGAAGVQRMKMRSHHYTPGVIDTAPPILTMHHPGGSKMHTELPHLEARAAVGPASYPQVEYGAAAQEEQPDFD